MAVVYIDDDASICWLMVREWTSACPHLPIHTTHNPAEALVKIDELGKELVAVIVDWRLKNITAENLVQELRVRWPRLCIIATSAVMDPKQLEAARLAGADRFIEKELSLRTFARQLATEIGKVLKERGDASPS